MTQVWVLFLGLRIPDLNEGAADRTSSFGSYISGGLYKTFLSSLPPSVLISFFLINALSLSVLRVLLHIHFGMSS
jgi:hypothetical protein